MAATIARGFDKAWILALAAALSSCGGSGDSEPAPPALTAQTLSFTAPTNQAFSTSPVALVASSSAGLAVSLASTTPAVCTVAGSSATLLTVGTCTISATQAGSATVAAATPVVNSFVISAAAQTITFVSPGNQAMGVPPAALMANSSSSLAVSFVSSTPSVCTVNGTALSLLAAGTCTVTASQAGNTNYAAATPVAHSFTVAVQMVAQTISFTAPGNQTIGSAVPPLVATASSGLPVAFASTTPTICTVNGAAVTLVAPGTCTVAASQAGNANFMAATAVLNSFAVAAAPQTISFSSPGAQTLGTAAPALSAIASSGLPVSFASTTPAVCTVNGTVLSLLTVGTCTVSASQAGNATVAAAAVVQQSFAVAAAAQSIAFSGPSALTLGTAPAALVASASSGLPVTISSTTPSFCTVNGTALTLVAAGSCSLTATQAGNASFAAATAVTRAVTVAPAPLTAQTITFAGPGTLTLGTAPAALVASASSSLPVSIASTTPTVCTVNGTTLTLVAAGSCSLTANQAGNTTFAAATAVTRTVTVSLTAQSITFAGPSALALGSTPAALVASASSGLPVSIASTTPTVCTVNGTTLTLVATGTCSLTASQAGNSTFAAATSVTRSVTVSAAPLISQSITFNLPTTATFGDPPAALVASASSGLAIIFQSVTPNICTINGSTLTLVGVGSCTVTAGQGGNSTYAAATTVTRTQVVSIAPATTQTIFFNAIDNQTLGTAPPQLSASASSGLPVSFDSSTASVCTVSGTTITLVAVGICTVNANQGGNTTFAPASVSRSFNVLAPVQTLTFNSPGNQTIGTPPPALVASSSAGLPVTFSSSTTSVCTVSGTTLTLVAVGTCTITANQAGNATYAPASLSRSFSVSAAAPASVELIANGGFESAPSAGQVAFGWRGVNARPATWSTDARTGARSLMLAVPDPGMSGSGLAGNSVDDGGQPSILGLYVGRTTTLTFWAKGNASFTGNVNFSLRYLDSTGNILNPVVNTSFGAQINANTWSQISLSGPAIPANTSAIFFEMTLAAGPTGVQPPGNCGVDNMTGQPLPCDYGQARVLIDDLSVRVNP